MSASLPFSSSFSPSSFSFFPFPFPSYPLTTLLPTACHGAVVQREAGARPEASGLEEAEASGRRTAVPPAAHECSPLPPTTPAGHSSRRQAPRLLAAERSGRGEAASTRQRFGAAELGRESDGSGSRDATSARSDRDLVRSTPATAPTGHCCEPPFGEAFWLAKSRQLASEFG